MDANERRKLAGSQAVEWWDRIHSEQPSSVVKQQYVDWLLESPVHVAEMLRVTSLHDELSHFENWAAICGEDSPGADTSVIDFAQRIRAKGRNVPAEEHIATSTSARMPFRRRSVMLGAAASVLVALLGWLLVATPERVIQTAQADRREITLDDGSVVQMDPESRLRVRLQARERLVHIDQGRAVFHVAKDAGRPFLVYASGTVVRAVGTAFGVEERSNEVIVTVAEGRVTVGPEPDAAAKSALSSGSGPLWLNANQQVVVASGVSEPVREVDSSRELAWAQGRLIFSNQSVTEIVRQFNRYNRLQLRIDGPQIASRRVSGVFEAADPESFVAILQAGGAAHAMRQSQQLIILAD